MLTIQTRTLNLSGGHYEIGYQLGKMIETNLLLKSKYIVKPEMTLYQIQETNQLLDKWCPGLTDEINGFADALNVSLESLFFYNMTCYIPHCSHIALLPSMTAEKRPLLARNYEFSCELEDFCLMRTVAKGNYTHIGTSMLQFGRDDGFNDQGLAVTISSCGLPVANLPHMKKPQFQGLQYWVVVRALLDNCKNTKEALAYLKDMPIVFNMNIILLDKTGHGALVQTMDGQKAFREIDIYSSQQMIHATNHSILSEFVHLEKQVFTHSIGRYQYIQKELEQETTVTREKLKEMLLDKYPDGLCFHNYKESFGTTKSMIISPIDGTIELCWGGRHENGWNLYHLSQPFDNQTSEIEIHIDDVQKGLFDWQSL